jgi:hypothetical protein
MAWTKTKMAIVAGVAALLVTGTATIVVIKVSHPIPASTNPLTVQYPVDLRYAGSDRRPGPFVVGPGRPVSPPNPNARFANLTPEQRVQQARRQLPESLDDLPKFLRK